MRGITASAGARTRVGTCVCTCHHTRALAHARTNERQFRDGIARPYTVLRKSLLAFAILSSGTRETAPGSNDEIVLARVDRRKRARELG